MSDSDKCFGERRRRNGKLGGAGVGLLNAQLRKCLRWESLCGTSQKRVKFEDLNVL